MADLGSQSHGSTLVLRIQRPEKRNALTVELVQAVRSEIERSADLGSRLVVLTGEGQAFCAGGDLPQLSALAREGATAATDAIYGAFHALVHAIHRCPAPVLAAVNGAALGAGLDLALACDLRIAAESARFASSWVALGLVPGMGGAHMLPRLIGGARAADILLFGRKISGREALNIGLVSELVADADLMDRALAIGEEIAALPEEGVRLTKAAMRRGMDSDFDRELATLGATQGGLLASEGFQSRADRFTSRRPG